MNKAGKASGRYFSFLLVASAILAGSQAGPAGANIILDPSLEGSPPGAWSESSIQGFSIIVEGGVGGAVPAHSGTFLAWLGGGDSETSQLWQTVEVPATAESGTLSWYQWLVTEDDPGFDFGFVQLDGTNVNVQDLAAEINPGDWLQRSVTVNLQPYAGSTVEVRFVATTDSVLTSSFFLDDITLDVIGGTPGGGNGGTPDPGDGGTPVIPAPPAAGLVLLGLGLLRHRRTAALRAEAAR